MPNFNQLTEREGVSNSSRFITTKLTPPQLDPRDRHSDSLDGIV